jgi:tyrosyl-tRNA synthetase
MDKIDEILTRGVEKIYPSREALEKVLRANKKMRLYQGFDPSMDNLHLGNMVGVLKLKQFQALGHEVIFLVGDFTGMIGDPTDKSATRKRLTRKEVLDNSKKWRAQAGKVLSFDGKNPAKILYNSRWDDKITFKDLIEITSHFTVQQMLERDFFQKRLKQGKPIHLHEFLYPVAQAIDCVEMDVDMEIGGNDQTFNILAGRTLMKALKGKEKFVLTTKLLVDSKGKKVGKTTGNALFLNASPNDMYSGVMSFPDEVIILAFELLTLVPLQSIEEMEKALRDGKNPIDLKKRLAFEIVKMYYSEKIAKQAQKEWERVVQKGALPGYIPTATGSFGLKKGNKIKIIDLLMEVTDELRVPSRSEAKRMIIQGGVEIDKKKIKDPNKIIHVKNGLVLHYGRRSYVQLKITK